MGKKEETSEKLEVLSGFEIIALIHLPDGFDFKVSPKSPVFLFVFREIPCSVSVYLLTFTSYCLNNPV